MGNTERLVPRYDVQLSTILHSSTASVHDDSMRGLVLAWPSLFLPLSSNLLWYHRAGVPHIYAETCHGTSPGSCVSCSCKKHARHDLIRRSTTASSAPEARHTIMRTGRYPTSGLLSQRALNLARHPTVPARLTTPPARRTRETRLLQLGRRVIVVRLLAW